jgi:hypothetical protein
MLKTIPVDRTRSPLCSIRMWSVARTGKHQLSPENTNIKTPVWSGLLAIFLAGATCWRAQTHAHISSYTLVKSRVLYLSGSQYTAHNPHEREQTQPRTGGGRNRTRALLGSQPIDTRALAILEGKQKQRTSVPHTLRFALTSTCHVFQLIMLLALAVLAAVCCHMAAVLAAMTVASTVALFAIPVLHVFSRHVHRRSRGEARGGRGDHPREPGPA